jgi:arylsulfatase A-like enzyme/Flp pilus assembly protein TadD
VTRRGGYALLALLALATAAGSCRRDGRDAGTSQAAARAPTAAESRPAVGSAGAYRVAPAGRPGLDILLITIDTLRADALGVYGKPNAGTPWMDRLAAEGVRFEEAHAHNVVTLPSHASLLSGLLPTHHGVRDNSGFRFPQELPTLASLLAAGGYRTGAFVSAFPLASRFGLTKGFEVYEDGFVDAGIRPAFVEQERPATETVALARAWIGEGDGRPTFTWVHLYEPHYPYVSPKPFAQQFADDPYQGGVAAVDAALAPLLEPLLGTTTPGNTLVVLTADHGESLGEHGEATHGIFAYEGPLRVPLVFYQPQLLVAGGVGGEARLVDVLPTILDLAAVPIPTGLDGASLLPAHGDAPTGSNAAPRTTYFEALSGPLNRGWAPLYGLLRDGWKYVDLPIPELYDLRSDPGENLNLAATDRHRADEMRQALATLRADDPGAMPSPETADVQERLRALGYLGGGGAPPTRSYSEADDPKRLIGLDRTLREVADLYETGELAAAAARCRELVRRYPDMRIAVMQLAQIERELGNLDAAVEAMRHASDLNPADTVALSSLATYLIQAGRAPEAVELTTAPVSTPQPDVELLLTHSLALARSDRIAAGLAAVGRARELEPGNPLVAVYAGTLHLMADRREDAAAAFEEALSLDPKTVRALTALAVMASEEGRIDDALGFWRRSGELDPREWGKLAAIGGRLWQAGQRSQGRALLELFVSSAPADLYGLQIEQARQAIESGGRPES